MKPIRRMFLPTMLAIPLTLSACGQSDSTDTLSADERQQLDRAAEMLESRDGKADADDTETLPAPFESE